MKRLAHHALVPSLALLLIALLPGVVAAQGPVAGDVVTAEFPAELVEFVPYEGNPIFTAAGEATWDAALRERGWILREGDRWRMWYTGYDGTRQGLKMLGYATSTDGLHWTRHADNPLYTEHWVEDMMVVPHGGRYYMFAEGRDDQAHLLVSDDGLHWTRQGPLDVRYANGKPLTPGPYGTPTAWFEDGVWYLFYERMDQGVWLAASRDMQVWTHLQDEPVLSPGPEEYDRLMIALNQIVKHGDRYYAYYHGTGDAERPRQWSTCVAVSDDLRRWTKFPGNPIVGDNKSSGILVHDGRRHRLYTMHDEVHAHFPADDQPTLDAE